MSVAMHTPFALRPMQPSDLDEVHRIELAAHIHPWSPELIRRELDHAWSRTMVAFEPGPSDGDPARMVGYIIFWLVHDELHILNVATDPVMRRRGVGRLLMIEAERQALAHNAVLATLEVRRSNVSAIALYAGLGYEQVGVRPRYYQPEGEDAFVMTKSLVTSA